MKNIYIRAGMSPLDSFTPTQILLKNSIGTNVGNLLYVYGILRTITQEDTKIIPNYYTIKLEDADKINETCDCFIIPLADAFRTDFVPELRNLTRFVKKLKIPCFVIGVGLRAPYDTDFKSGFPFDDAVKDFVSAVLEKSSMIGVRGQITADYLSSLGFRDGIDHMAIGCPSMYSFGPELTIRQPHITTDSRISCNMSTTTPDNMLTFISRTVSEFPDYHFVPQVLNDLRLLYLGIPFKYKGNSFYPNQITNEICNGSHSQFFINLPSWFDFLKTVDFSFGTRLHGNIAATLSGTPSILFPKDARVRELADYHHLTQVPYQQVNENTSIWDLIEKADFNEVSRYQKENFDRFIGFLEKNGIDHIYKDGKAPDSVPLDTMMASVKMQPPVTSIAACDLTEINRRYLEYYPSFDAKVKNTSKKCQKLQNEVNTLKAQAQPSYPLKSGLKKLKNIFS